MNGRGRARPGRVLAALALACLAAAGCRPPADMPTAPPATAPAVPADPAARLARQCDAAMGAGTCAVMNADAAPAPGERVFVAGLGEVDGALYAQLRTEGATMCARVQRHCREDWDGEACRLARVLYGAMPVADTPTGR